MILGFGATQVVWLLNGGGSPVASCVNLGWVHLAFDAYNGVLRPASNQAGRTITRATDALLLDRSKTERSGEATDDDVDAHNTGRYAYCPLVSDGTFCTFQLPI